MNLFEKIIDAYPELQNNNNFFADGTIGLRDDSDGKGAYIEYWNYAKPLPAGLQIGKG